MNVKSYKKLKKITHKYIIKAKVTRSDKVAKDTFFNLNVEKQEKVMRAAISEFLKYGFEKSNIGNIAKNAGVAKGSIYQYFEDKKDLFMFSVQWSTELLMKKYGYPMRFEKDDISIYEYFYEASKETWLQLREEREVFIFLQDIFIGKFSIMKNESMDYWMKISDEYILKFIQSGKSKGYIRKDIDDNIICIFMTGAFMRFKEHILNRARNTGESIIDEGLETYCSAVKGIIELVENGMKAR